MAFEFPDTINTPLDPSNPGSIFACQNVTNAGITERHNFSSTVVARNFNITLADGTKAPTKELYVNRFGVLQVEPSFLLNAKGTEAKEKSAEYKERLALTQQAYGDIKSVMMAKGYGVRNNETGGIVIDSTRTAQLTPAKIIEVMAEARMLPEALAVRVAQSLCSFRQAEEPHEAIAIRRNGETMKLVHAAEEAGLDVPALLADAIAKAKPLRTPVLAEAEHLEEPVLGKR